MIHFLSELFYLFAHLFFRIDKKVHIQEVFLFNMDFHQNK